MLPLYALSPYLNLSHRYKNTGNLRRELEKAKKVNRVTSLNVEGNNIDDEGLNYIIDSFVTNPQSSVTVLNLCENKITNIGAIALLEAFKENERFKRVELRANPGVDLDIIHEFEAISKSRTIENVRILTERDDNILPLKRQRSI